MSNETKQTPTHPLVAIAGACAGASVGIVAVTFMLLHNISEGGMWAIAAMAAAPSGMGIGIAYFMTKNPPQESASSRTQSQP